MFFQIKPAYSWNLQVPSSLDRASQTLTNALLFFCEAQLCKQAKKGRGEKGGVIQPSALREEAWTTSCDINSQADIMPFPFVGSCASPALNWSSQSGKKKISCEALFLFLLPTPPFQPAPETALCTWSITCGFAFDGGASGVWNLAPKQVSPHVDKLGFWFPWDNPGRGRQSLKIEK